MKWIQYLGIVILSIITFPYTSIPLFLMVIFFLRGKNISFLLVGCVASLCIDITWGRIIGLEIIFLVLYDLSLRSIARIFVSIQHIYFLPYIITFFCVTSIVQVIYENIHWQWKNWLIWLMIQILFSLVFYILIAVINKYQQQKSYLSTRSMQW
jgi:hypothetical protein